MNISKRDEEEEYLADRCREGTVGASPCGGRGKVASERRSRTKVSPGGFSRYRDRAPRSAGKSGGTAVFCRPESKDSGRFSSEEE